MAFAALANLLNLPQKDEPDLSVLAEAVRRWPEEGALYLLRCARVIPKDQSLEATGEARAGRWPGRFLRKRTAFPWRWIRPGLSSKRRPPRWRNTWPSIAPKAPSYAHAEENWRRVILRRPLRFRWPSRVWLRRIRWQPNWSVAVNARHVMSPALCYDAGHSG